MRAKIILHPTEVESNGSDYSFVPRRRSYSPFPAPTKVWPSCAAAINDGPQGLSLTAAQDQRLARRDRVRVHPSNRSERESRSTAHRDQNSERCDRSFVNKGLLRPGHRRSPPSLGRLLMAICHGATHFSRRPIVVLTTVCVHCNLVNMLTKASIVTRLHFPRSAACCRGLENIGMRNLKSSPCNVHHRINNQPGGFSPLANILSLLPTLNVGFAFLW